MLKKCKIFVLSGCFFWLFLGGAQSGEIPSNPPSEQVVFQFNPFLKYDAAPIFRAAFEGRLSRLKQLIKRTPDFHFDQPTVEGQALLHLAAMQGHLRVVQYLIKQKASYRMVDQWGRTPLYYAVSRGHVPVVRYWLKHKFSKFFVANSIAQKYFRFTDYLLQGPLHWAAWHGQNEMLQFLLQQGWSVEARGIHGYTPALLAVLKGQLEVLKLLAHAGADLNASTHAGESLLWQAVQHKRWPIARWLVDQGVRTDITLHKKTLLQFVIQQGSLQGLQLLQRAGLDLKAQAQSVSILPVHWALEAKAKPEMLQALVRLGANVNQANTLGHRPLHYAVLENQQALAQTLVDLGADVNALTISDRSALIFAVQQQQADMVKWLLQQGARPTYLHPQARWNLLHEAAMLGDVDVTRVLLQQLGLNEISLNVDEREGLTERTPLGVALTHGHLKVAQLLLQYGANLRVRLPKANTLYYLAIRDQNLKAIQFLHAQGLELHLRNHDMLTPLQLAVARLLYRNHKSLSQIIDFFLSLKACVQVVDTQGNGLLHWVYPLRDEALMRKFIQHGARENLNFARTHKSTLLHWAIEKKEAPLLEQLLANQSSDQDCEGLEEANRPGVWASLEQLLQTRKNSYTPFLLAIKRDQLKMVKLLWQRAQALKPEASASQLMQFLSGPQEAKRAWLSAWEVAVFAGHQSIMQYLVAQGVSPYWRDSRGRTALHWVTMQGRLDLVQYLVGLGLNVNRRENWAGRTALHIAVIKGHKDIVEFLLQAGADTRIVDLMRQTPAAVARRWKKDELARLLDEATK